MGVRSGGKTHICPPWKLGLRTRYFWKNLKSASSFRLIDLVLAMTMFLPIWNSHCTEVRFTAYVMQWWACSSLMSPPLPAEACCESREWIVLLLVSIAYNTMATDLQKFTLYYGSRRFVAWDCWTHTSCQVMQRVSDMLIAVSHVRLYFVKRSTSESNRNA